MVQTLAETLEPRLRAHPVRAISGGFPNKAAVVAGDFKISGPTTRY